MNDCLNDQRTAPVILLVEDDPLVRLVAAEILASAGYAVVEAEDAVEAIAYLARGNAPEVLVTDVRMPGSIDGIELAVIVARRWPAIGIIVCSAHACPSDDELPEGAVFLAKPHPAGALVREVARMLEPTLAGPAS